MANISQMYQQLLGRAATPEEASYLQKFVNEGNLDEGEIGQIIQSMPEFQQKQLQTDTSAFNDRLTANDNQFLSNATDRIGAQVNSRFASLGRPVSSAMAASAFGQAGQIAQGLQQNRQSMLADFYGKGLQGIRGSQQNQGQGALERGYGLKNRKMERDWDVSDYNRQQNDFNNYQNSKSGWNAITPEFAINTAIGTAGKIGSAYMGGYGASRGAAGKGLF